MLKIEEVETAPEMPEEKIIAMLEEFPIIMRIVKNRPKRIFVSRIGAEFLSCRTVSKSMGSGYCAEQDWIYFLDKEGNPFQLGWQTLVEYKPHWGGFLGLKREETKHAPQHFSNGERIGTTIDQIEKAGSQVHMVLWARSASSEYGEFRGEKSSGETVIIYRPPKGLSITEWTRRLVNAEREKMMLECKKIDDEASA